MGWAWTWVNFPKELTNIFNKSTVITLEFDFSFDDNGKSGYSLNNFGLMYDLHNVTDDCPGGNFYELYFTRENDEIQTAFRKNDNCHLGEARFYKQGSSVPLKALNHLAITKSGLRYSIQVNGQVVLELNFVGNISLNSLRYSRGQYSFDNFNAYSNVVELPNLSQPTPTPTRVLPKIWALCVGIEDYSGYPGYPDNISDLNYCIDDAQSYYSFLSSVRGGNIPTVQLKLLTSARQTTNENILLVANEMFSKAAENDLVIVFLSGHGGSGYYCASNGELRYEEINKILESSRAKRKLLLADACHSGTWASQKDVFAPRGQKLTDDEALKLFYSELSASSRNVMYLLAAGPNELSWEKNGHGIFTYFFIEGLSCKAKKANSPIITVGDVYNYLSERVYNATKNEIYQGRLSPQHPILGGQVNLDMPVSICNE